MERTLKLKIDPEICQCCERCEAARVCRMKAIVQIDPGEQPYIEGSRCRDCWICVPACPHGAVQKIFPDWITH